MKKIILLLQFLTVISYSQWQVVSNGMGTQESIQAICTAGNIIYAGSELHGVYVTTNNGALWTQTSLNNVSAISLTINGLNVLAGTISNGVYRSTNGGVNWNQTSLNNLTVFSFANIGSTIYAGTGNGVFISTNSGLNWTQTTLSNRVVNSLAITGNNIFAGTANYGVYISTNNGNNWAQTTLNSQYVFSLAIDGNNVFAGTSANGLYISTNSGLTWTPSTLTNQTIRSIVMSGNNLFCGIDGFNCFWVSNNFGISWTPRTEGMIKAAFDALCISNNYIFGGTNGGGIFRRSLSEITGLLHIPSEIPDNFSLSQNYPNPFNPATNIKFTVPQKSFVTISIYNVLGKEVSTLLNENLSTGTYETSWDAGNYPSGVYYYKLVVGDNNNGGFTETKKMVLIK